VARVAPATAQQPLVVRVFGALSEIFVRAKGKTEIQGNRIRLALGPEVLRSTLLMDITASKKTVRFTGRGWGHGVGLCQWGARGRALVETIHQARKRRRQLAAGESAQAGRGMR